LGTTTVTGGTAARPPLKQYKPLSNNTTLALAGKEIRKRNKNGPFNKNNLCINQRRINSKINYHIGNLNL
jgi:hypothetical protein